MPKKEVSVSIIMPTYNRGYIIKKTIESVLLQSYTDFELLIIDDGSTDNTQEVVGEFNDERIIYIKNDSNKGACYARNIGLKKSKGEYIAFLDSDNIWNKYYLRKRIDKMTSNIGLVWGPIVLNNFEGQQIIPSQNIIKTISHSSRTDIIRMMIYGNIIDTNAVVVRKVYLSKENGFDESLYRLQDWDYFFRIIQNDKYDILFDDEILVENFLQKDSIGTDENLGNYWDAVNTFLSKYKNMINQEDNIVNVYKHYCLSKDVTRAKDLAFLQNASDEDIRNLIYILSRQYNDIIDVYNKNCRLVDILNAWIRENSDNSNFVLKYMEEQGAKTIAIYGAGKIGITLITELKRKGIDVKAVIDKNRAGGLIEDYLIVSPEEYDDTADLVIISVIDIADQVKEKYDKRGTYVSIEELLMHKE